MKTDYRHIIQAICIIHIVFVVKMGYSDCVLFCTVFLLRCVAVITVAIAPGDQQSQCTTTQGVDAPGLGLINAYTSTQTPLMDMYWYVLAFSNFGIGVWESIKGSNGFNADGVSRDMSDVVYCM